MKRYGLVLLTGSLLVGCAVDTADDDFESSTQALGEKTKTTERGGQLEAVTTAKVVEGGDVIIVKPGPGKGKDRGKPETPPLPDQKPTRIPPGFAKRVEAMGKGSTVEVDIFLRDPWSIKGQEPEEKAASASGEFNQGKQFDLMLLGKPAARDDFEEYQKWQHEQFRRAEGDLRDRFAAVAKKLSAQTGLELRTKGGRSVRAKATRRQIKLLVKEEELVRSVTEAYRPEGQDGIISALMAVGVSPTAFNLGLDGDSTGVWMNDGNGKPITTNVAIDTSDLTGQDYGTEPFENHATQTLACLMATAPEAHVHYAVPTESCNLRTDVTTFSSPPVYLSSQSNSFGDDDTTYSACSEDWDDFIYDTRIAHFALTQNEGSTIRGAGKAYNVISIGAFDDTTTPFSIAAFSNFVDPDTGADKPEVVAPGVDVDIAGWTGVNGTSFATPIAAGFAADIMEAYTHTRYQPQLLKAYLMSNAVNVDGGTPFSDTDGAGRVDFSRTYYNGRWAWWTGGYGSWYNDDTDGDGRMEIAFTTSLVAGRTYRAVISWLVKASYVQSNDRPNMDIDLKITAPNGSRWTSSSVSQNYELVEFTAPQSGTYDVVIERYSNSGQGKVALGYHLTW